MSKPFRIKVSVVDIEVVDTTLVFMYLVLHTNSSLFFHDSLPVTGSEELLSTEKRSGERDEHWPGKGSQVCWPDPLLTSFPC